MCIQLGLSNGRPFCPEGPSDYSGNSTCQLCLSLISCVYQFLRIIQLRDGRSVHTRQAARFWLHGYAMEALGKGTSLFFSMQPYFCLQISLGSKKIALSYLDGWRLKAISSDHKTRKIIKGESIIFYSQHKLIECLIWPKHSWKLSECRVLF